jgi:hypothetical protein
MQARKFMLTGLTALVTAAAAGVQAQSTTGTSSPGDGSRSWLPYTQYGYVGGSIGRSDYEQDNCLLLCDDRATGFKLFSGGQVSQWFGVELSYVNLGEVDRNGGDVRAQGLNFSLLGQIPVSEQFKIFGKLGTMYGYARTRAPAGQPSGHEDRFGLSYGLGLQLDINRNWAVRGDWDRYRLKYVDRRDDADLYSVGLVYKF